MDSRQTIILEASCLLAVPLSIILVSLLAALIFV